MPLSHAPLSSYSDGNLIVGTGASVPLHTATFDEYTYIYAVNDKGYELPLRITVKNGSNEAEMTFSVIPDSHEQLVLDGLPLAPGTTVGFVASYDVAVHGHVLRDI